MKQWFRPTSATFDDATTGLLFSFTAERHVDKQEAIQRILCHYIIELIPKQGIPELVDTLRNIYEFYSPVDERTIEYLAPPKQVKARLGTTTLRPDFSVVYDEE